MCRLINRYWHVRGAYFLCLQFKNNLQIEAVCFSKTSLAVCRLTWLTSQKTWNFIITVVRTSHFVQVKGDCDWTLFVKYFVAGILFAAAFTCGNPITSSRIFHRSVLLVVSQGWCSNQLWDMSPCIPLTLHPAGSCTNRRLGVSRVHHYPSCRKHRYKVSSQCYECAMIKEIVS